MLLILCYVLIIASIGLAVWAIRENSSGRLQRVRLTSEPVADNRVKMRSYLTNILPFTKGLLEKLKLEQKLKMRIDAAHVTMSPQEFINLKILLIVIFEAVIIFLLRNYEAWALALGAVLAYVIPDIILRRKLKQRKEAIARLLPETVDLLGLCVEAGLDFTTACKWLIEKIPRNPLIEELAFVLEEIKWGKPRVQALRDMSRRLNIPEVSSFVQTLVQAERMGTPVAEAFAILSEDTRLQRFHRGERIAMAAPIKILIPLIFCILPVIGIVIGGPIFLQFMEGGLLKGITK